MSVGPGALGYVGGAVSVLGAEGMSVAPPLGFGGGSVAPGMSIGPGMSVGPMSFGPMQPGFPVAPMPMMQPPQMQYGGLNHMAADQYDYAVAAARNRAAQHYGGGGSMYGSLAMGGQMPPVQMQMTMKSHPQMPQKSDKHPISEIKIGK